jgi:hypothetical protein
MQHLWAQDKRPTLGLIAKLGSELVSQKSSIAAPCATANTVAAAATATNPNFGLSIAKRRQDAATTEAVKARTTLAHAPIAT